MDPSLSALKQLTLEARVYMNSFQTSDPYISSIMGIEAVCCVRFGDVKIDNNVLRFAMIPTSRRQPTSLPRP